MKLVRSILLVLALLVFSTSAGTQDQAKHQYQIVVGHVVTIAWTASTTTDVPSYNIYVSGTSGGPYTKIGTTNSLQFADIGGIAGTTYFYVVTAVGPNGESANSAEVSITLPTP